MKDDGATPTSTVGGTSSNNKYIILHTSPHTHTLTHTLTHTHLHTHLHTHTYTHTHLHTHTLTHTLTHTHTYTHTCTHTQVYMSLITHSSRGVLEMWKMMLERTESMAKSHSTAADLLLSKVADSLKLQKKLKEQAYKKVQL